MLTIPFAVDTGICHGSSRSAQRAPHPAFYAAVASMAMIDAELAYVSPLLGRRSETTMELLARGGQITGRFLCCACAGVPAVGVTDVSARRFVPG
jgi:hypothetical protein